MRPLPLGISGLWTEIEPIFAARLARYLVHVHARMAIACLMLLLRCTRLYV